jgi:hypothetical protein
MVKELLEETTEDELDDILQVLIPGPDDKKRRAELIHAVFVCGSIALVATPMAAG